MRRFALSLLALFLIVLPLSAAVTLEEYLDASSYDWFLTGKTSYLIEGKMVSEDTPVSNYLEMVDYVAKDNGVDVVLKGTAGELWVTKLQKVLSTYTKEDGSELDAEDFVPDEFITLRTKANPGTNYAMFVPVDTIVLVETAWGDLLTANHPDTVHGEGDYLVCSAGTDGAPDLSDVWVVNGEVFPDTYSMSH